MTDVQLMSTPSSLLSDPLALRARPKDHPRTDGFVEHVHTSEFHLATPWTRAWQWLETPETFSDGQIWPYRVDFLAVGDDTPAGFYEGGLNIHHGPLLSLPGRLDTIEETAVGGYRSLSYLYGSYVLSLRLIRPTRLEFQVFGEGESGEEATGVEARSRVRVRLSSDVAPWIERPWSRLQGLFWSRLGDWMAKSLGSERIS